MNPAGIGTPPIFDERVPFQLPLDLQLRFGQPAVGQIRPDYSWQLLLLGVGLGVLLMMLLNRGGEQ
jgi:hypothetical protein